MIGLNSSMVVMGEYRHMDSLQDEDIQHPMVIEYHQLLFK